MKRALITLLLALVGLIALTDGVHACVCRMPPTVYEEFARSHIVFTGKVVSLRNNDTRSGGVVETERYYTFDVDTAYKGLKEKSVEVGGGYLNTSCSRELTIGQSYLVYARDPKGAGYVSDLACGLVESVESAGDQISLIKGILQDVPEPQIYGSLILENENKENIVLKNTKVLLKGAVQNWEAATDQYGVFRFSGVPKGNYSIVPVLPETQRVKVADTEAIIVAGNGRIYTRKFANNLDELMYDFRGDRIAVFADGLPGSIYTEFSIAPNYGVLGRVVDAAGKRAKCEKAFLVNIASLKSLKDKEAVTKYILSGINDDALSGWSWCGDEGGFNVPVAQKGEYVLAIETKNSLFFHPQTDIYQNAEIIALTSPAPVKRDFKLLKSPSSNKK